MDEHAERGSALQTSMPQTHTAGDPDTEGHREPTRPEVAQRDDPAYCEGIARV
jgi:hypothetical protein